MSGNTTRRRFLAGAGSAAVFAASGCGESGTGSRTGNASNVAPGVLNFGNGAELSSLDPHHIEGTWEFNVVGELLMGVTTEDRRSRPVPGSTMSR